MTHAVSHQTQYHNAIVSLKTAEKLGIAWPEVLTKTWCWRGKMFPKAKSSIWHQLLVFPDCWQKQPSHGAILSLPKTLSWEVLCWTGSNHCLHLDSVPHSSPPGLQIVFPIQRSLLSVVAKGKQLQVSGHLKRGREAPQIYLPSKVPLPPLTAHKQTFAQAFSWPVYCILTPRPLQDTKTQRCLAKKLFAASVAPGDQAALPVTMGAKTKRHATWRTVSDIHFILPKRQFNALC